MSDRGLIYIAGPMTGIEHFNAPAFYAAERQLIEAGYSTINPARVDLEERSLNTLGMTGHEDLSAEGFDYGEVIDEALAQVKGCDGVATLDGWEDSTGATVEVAYAYTQGVEVDDLDRWLT